MGNRRKPRAAIIATLAALPLAAGADSSSDELLQRIEQQGQRLRELKRELEVLDETADTTTAPTPVVEAGRDGFSLKSADGRNQLRLRGTLHIDGQYLEGADPGAPADGWQATRVRPIIEGTLGEIYDFKVMPDFGRGRTVLQDAYVTARFTPAFQLMAGKFKSPVGLERLQSANDNRFVARGLPTGLVPNRDIGLQVGGSVLGGRLGYAAAWLNGANDGSSSETFGDADMNDEKEFAFRLFAQPFVENGSRGLRGLGIGIAGTWTDQTGDAMQPLLSTIRSTGQATIFHYRTGPTATIANGERTRLAPQFHYYAGSLGLIGEYTAVSQDVSRVVPRGVRSGTVDMSAWQLAASWFLTGEDEAFRGFTPKARFSVSGGTWGAFEVVARAQALNVGGSAFAAGDDSFADPLTSVRGANAYGVGLNWYLNENFKWMLDFEHTGFEGGAPDGDRRDEDAWQLRFALGF